MAVPAPSRTAASAQAVNVSVAAIQASAAPWSSMPRDDERFAAVAVGDRPGRELAESPDGWVERGEYPDLAQRESGGGEQQREQAPGEAVVEVVDHAGLRRRGQRGFAVADQRGDLSGGQVGAEGAVGGGGAGDGEVAGGLVETHGQAAAVRAGEVDFHDDGGGPGQALVDAEQDVGGDDPGPRRRPDDHEGYR